jgi:putative membrane protein
VVSLAPADRDRVSAAVAEAEAASHGEIVTIVAERSDAYHDVGLHYAVLAMLLVPALIAALPQALVDRTLALFAGWNETVTRGALMAALFAALALAFLLVRYLLALPRLRMALTPGATKTRRVRRRAVELFRAAAERRTTGRTGVLLYLSLLERRAEIVADEAIHSKVAPEVWGDAMAALLAEVKNGRPADGMIKAVQLVGGVLAEHVPLGQGDVNELPDRLITL